jgi:hypothetical protein
MMKFTSIKNDETIECGDATCRAESGTPCIFLAVRLNGEDAACLHNLELGSFTPLRRKNGWIKRSERCMNLFLKPVDKK